MPAFDTLWKNLATEVEQGKATPRLQGGSVSRVSVVSASSPNCQNHSSCRWGHQAKPSQLASATAWVLRCEEVQQPGAPRAGQDGCAIDLFVQVSLTEYQKRVQDDTRQPVSRNPRYCPRIASPESSEQNRAAHKQASFLVFAWHYGNFADFFIA